MSHKPFFYPGILKGLDVFFRIAVSARRSLAHHSSPQPPFLAHIQIPNNLLNQNKNKRLLRRACAIRTVHQPRPCQARLSSPHNDLRFLSIPQAKNRSALTISNFPPPHKRTYRTPRRRFTGQYSKSRLNAFYIWTTNTLNETAKGRGAGFGGSL